MSRDVFIVLSVGIAILLSAILALRSTTRSERALSGISLVAFLLGALALAIAKRQGDLGSWLGGAFLCVGMLGFVVNQGWELLKLVSKHRDTPLDR